MNFSIFKRAVALQFQKMAEHGTLFYTKVEKDDVWETYLSSFPPGTNKIYRERREFDCSCCKQFVRAVGNVVSVIDGKMVSIWDIQVVSQEPTFQTVANALSALVKSKPIDNLFVHTENTAGTDKSFEDAVERVTTWEHFFVNIPRNLVLKGDRIGPTLSEHRSTHDVMLRSLIELRADAAETILELIAQNSLYRGEEHKFALTEFLKLKKEFDKIISNGEPDLYKQDLYVWDKIGSVAGSVARMRNTSIGTLLTSLSEGVELEDAVKAFEAMVAPANYKRPTALVTKSMIDAAKRKLEELGLISALNRRYARLTDITVNNILFANREARKSIRGDIFDEISTKALDRRKYDKVEDVPVAKFLTDILPRATSIEVMVENGHINNLVSLVAPQDPTANSLFKWANKFSWSYNGDFADSIKERVKKAGGDVTGEFCNRLAWFNYDDLDLHMVEADGYEIYFGNRAHTSPSGGRLDVDMNAGSGTTREPVENIFYKTLRGMKPGSYTLVVHNYMKRESDNVGFEVEVDILGVTHRYSYQKAVKNGERIPVCRVVKSREGLEIVESFLPSSQTSKKVWNVQTHAFHPVSVLMLSPNHWDGHGVGNKHYFFMLDGCINDGQARGFFNEFLKPELDSHRKVIEIVGSKMKTEETTEQLSGVGFSSTQRNSILCRVEGSFSRVVNLIF